VPPDWKRGGKETAEERELHDEPHRGGQKKNAADRLREKKKDGPILSTVAIEPLGSPRSKSGSEKLFQCQELRESVKIEMSSRGTKLSATKKKKNTTRRMYPAKETGNNRKSVGRCYRAGTDGEHKQEHEKRNENLPPRGARKQANSAFAAPGGEGEKSRAGYTTPDEAPASS